MDPNRHHEYQTHHQTHQLPHPPHHQQSHAHHQQPLHQPAGSSSGGYNAAEQERSRAIYLMNTIGQAASALPPAGAALIGGSGSGGLGDPHSQYYTSNRDLPSKKSSTTPATLLVEHQHQQQQQQQHQQQQQQPPSQSWQYKTQNAIPGPAPRHHSSPMYIHTTTNNATGYWPPEDQSPGHRGGYNYNSKPAGNMSLNQPPPSHTQGRPSAISSCSSSGSSGNGSQQRYYDDVKYSVPTVATSAKMVSYPPAQQPPRMSMNYDLDHVINPSNALMAPGEQQPSPNYGRKCPQHYEPPERRAAAAAAPPPAAPPAPPPPTSTTTHHQSLYMPMPQFSTEKFQTTVHNAIEKYVRETPAQAPPPTLDYRRSLQASHPPANYGGRSSSNSSSSSYYGQQTQLKSVAVSPAHYAHYGGTPSAPTASTGSKQAPPTASYVKMEPEHALPAVLSVPQTARASLYHNPYNASPHSDSACCKEQRVSSPAAPHGYPTKYGKLLQQHGTPTPPPPAPPTQPTRLPASSSSSAYYYHGSPSPAAATVASPTPATLYSHTPPPTAPSTANYSTLQVYPHGPDICCQPKAPPSSTKQRPMGLPPAVAPAITVGAKKTTPAPKPNYRALINDMLKRNTASEEEMNLQIIKKTLNMETPCRPLVAPMPAPLPAPVIQAPQSSAHSPLDLSMRTVKQTADSTDYKYQRPLTEYKPLVGSSSSSSGGGGGGGATGIIGGTGLPRFDITPNFSAATRGTPPLSGQPTPLANPTAVIRTAPSSSYSAQQHTHSHVPIPPAAAPALVIKSVQQLRPSVVETNPYAKRQLLACEQLPPETSIMALPKALPSTTTPTPPATPSPHHPSSNPNYLGRKRHLAEYNQATAAAAKQTRCEAPPPTSTSTVVRAAEIPVIAFNEQALASKLQLQTPHGASLGGGIIVTPPLSCKQEPLTPTTPTPTSTPLPVSTSMLRVVETTPIVVPKTEQRIRTKAELKGFTFTPPVLAAASSTTPSIPIGPATTANQLTNNIQIKLEPAPPLPSTLPNALSTTSLTPPCVDLGLEDVSPFNSNLLDWGNACNNLVEQLLTKVVLPKHSSPASAAAPLSPTPISIKLELSEDDLPVARILKCKPLAFDVESPATSNSFTLAASQLTTATTTTNTNGLLMGGTQKKLSKTEREKKRLQQEQRIAARLAPSAGQGSSSESDTTELHKRKTERQKKPLLMRKGKARRTTPTSPTTNENTVQDAKVKREEQSSDEEQDNSSDASVGDVKPKKRLEKVSTKLKDNVQYAKIKGKAKAKESEASASGSSSSSGAEEKQHKKDGENKDKKQKPQQERREGSQAKPKQATVCKQRSTLKARIALNTMTRSKRKKELELQLANSKVLRNDKIIRNSTTKIKRKYVRKMVAAQTVADKKEIMCTRLRNKRGIENASGVPTAGGVANGRKTSSKIGINATGTKNSSPQQQLYLEEYRYKLALKIPHRLISINKLNNSNGGGIQKLPGVASSLPDLERRDLSQELACFKSNRGRKPRALKQTETTTPKSIIDVLHLRVTSNGGTQPLKQTMHSSATILTTSTTTTSLHNYSETSQTSASNSLYDQPHETTLPPPTPSGANTVSSSDLAGDLSKRHFSIFDTKVLQSKTRTESKLQQRREIIREIFVGPERPASAPPECAQQEGALSYQKYEEFLEQMNRIVSANNNKLARRQTTNNNINSEQNHDAEKTTTPHCPHKRKYLRRKGSSGFDYIRKKKRPNPHGHPTGANNSNCDQNSSTGLITGPVAGGVGSVATALTVDERLEDTDSTIAGSSHLPPKIKTEADVYREIQKWVLNKGVGQSTMHKAARQGLIDVVVYCLDRLGMNPDQKDNAGYTPLHEACTQGCLEIARVLLQFGANHSEAAQSGIRPLHGAIENDHEEVVRLLLSYGADPLLATYSGQTPLMLASSKLMRNILRAHLSDAQSVAADIKPMILQGPWEIFDKTENGYDIFDNVPKTACDMSRALRREKKVRKRRYSSSSKKEINSTNFNNRNNNGLISGGNNDCKADCREMLTTTMATIKQNGETSATKTAIMATGTGAEAATTMMTTMTKKETETMMLMASTVKLEQTDQDSNNNKNNDELNDETNVVNVKNELKNEVIDNNNEKPANDKDTAEYENEDDAINTDADELNGDIFEFEEADVLLPPLYLLKDEGSDKWVLLNDLCNLLKVKSKDTLLNKIYPNSNSLATAQKQLLREFKMSDFLEKATCLQLLCAGEKLNMGASKVVLIKYNESVRNLLGVKTILMKF
ncbi:uncharacterized protein LOC115621909 [Scaptodrosophila lebanonensis]|uniref:Uncharacterized protein LOC115621909 n=1 Tax=Drosophila lebanonensis TaxID=7225 RepID=A0A6J2T3Y1_DROLE|nr:uncharacterized protein LOC115621909 [Scaptodrosophila lebanonensis]XP_030371611.1 uncharacterized protein LOC115621909 [Scaptodrosophila lebanonensis]